MKSAETMNSQSSPLFQNFSKPVHHSVDRSSFDAQIEAALARVSDPEQGFFGESSVLWKIMRFNYPWLIGASRMLILQSMHLWMAQAGTDSSYGFRHPMKRAVNTFLAMSKIIFSNVDMALETAEGIRRIHERIYGEMTHNEHPFEDDHYEANDAYALFWVHATLWETTVKTYELLYKPLTLEEKTQLHEELSLMALLFGIPKTHMTNSWEEFIEYNHTMWRSNQLGSDGSSREFALYFLNDLSETMPIAFKPFFYHLREFTISVLPEPVRAKLELNYDLNAAKRFLWSMKMGAKFAIIPVPYNGLFLQRKAHFARKKKHKQLADRYWLALDTLPMILLRITTLVFLTRKRTDDGMHGYREVIKEIIAYRKSVNN